MIVDILSKAASETCSIIPAVFSSLVIAAVVPQLITGVIALTTAEETLLLNLQPADYENAQGAESHPLSNSQCYILEIE